MPEQENEESDEASATPHLRRRPQLKKLYLTGLAAAIAIVVAGDGILQRREHEHAVAKWTEAAAIPSVSVVTPMEDVSDPELVLPGDVQAWYEAAVYARVSGYLKKWYFDIGAGVKKGQVLAEIDAPDVDAQLSAARAKLRATNATIQVRDAEARFASTTFARWRDSPKGVVSVQEQESKQADYERAAAQLNAAKADAAVAQAEVDRLEALESFKRVVAPFDGVVTSRETDIGALINAGSGAGAGSAPELFRVADTHKVRIYVKAPQRMARSIHSGVKAAVHLPQYPDKIFDAVVTSTSRAVNVSSRTLLVELQADNPDGLFQPGAFAEIHFTLPSPPNVVRIPTSALLFREHGLEVAVVGADGKVTLKKINIGRNLGTEVEVLQGLAPSDRVVDSPPDALGSGDAVQIADKTAMADAATRLQ
ncbi:efflux RND transporter periplasmic adaptor subunit [Bradyrhizobium cenepequi]